MAASVSQRAGSLTDLEINVWMTISDICPSSFTGVPYRSRVLSDHLRHLVAAAAAVIAMARAQRVPCRRTGFG